MTDSSLPKNRLFFALMPDDETRAACALAARDLRTRMQPGGYLTSAERYHVTLLFLDDHVPSHQEAAAKQVAQLVSLPPFILTLDQANSFKNREIPWVLAPMETPPELTLLHDHLRDALRSAGVTVKSMRLTPHLTVVRNAKVLLPPTQIKPVVWDVKEFVLIRSVLEEQPPRYEILGRWPLNGVWQPKQPPPQMSLF